MDLQTLNFNITPPSVASQCILHYSIMSTSNGRVLPNISVAVPTDHSLPFTVTKDIFDLCKNTYKFYVMAVTKDGSAISSPVVQPEQVRFLGKTSSSVRSIIAEPQ